LFGHHVAAAVEEEFMQIKFETSDFGISNFKLISLFQRDCGNED
jgi:hypothetical protein